MSWLVVAGAIAVGLALPTAAEAAVPTCAPDKPWLTAATTSSVTATWSGCTAEALTGFRLELIPAGSTTATKTTEVPAATRSVTFSGLAAGALYSVRASALNGSGAGPASALSLAGGPNFQSVAELVDRQYRDFTGAAPTSSAASAAIGALGSGATTPTQLIDDLQAGAYWRVQSPVIRLFKAYFLRLPDQGGLTYWTGKARSGTSLSTISSSFAGSSEFATRYGSRTDYQFVLLVYDNVLGRPGDAGGIDYWTAQLAQRKRSRGAVMLAFSESNEYKRKVGPTVDVVNITTGMLRRVPTTAEVTAWTAQSHAAVINTLLAQPDYLARVKVTVGSTLTAGENVCALRPGGRVWCWGSHDDQDYTGAVAPWPSQPRYRGESGPIAGVSGATSVAVGRDSACAIVVGGVVRCWGGNYSGQLGVGVFSAPKTAGDVKGLVDVVSLSVGPSYACAVVRSGVPYCWGYNATGQLGNGTTNRVSLPTRVSGLSDVAAIDAGDRFACALLRSGSVRCWGANDLAQLGNGTQGAPVTKPANVSGLSSVVGLSVGSDSACAVLANGGAKCWGEGTDGALGNPDYATLVPVDVTGLTGAASVSAYGLHACAARTNGTVWCWGNNWYGTVGPTTSAGFDQTDSPRQVPGLTGITSVAAGYELSCAASAAWVVSCWGDPVFSIGISQGFIGSFTPGSVGGLSNPTSVAAGGDHACAIQSGGTVRCWGANAAGELGNGTTVDSAVPVTVTGISGATAIDVGLAFSCALMPDGTVRCWGSNSNGQLGTTSTPDGIPVTIAGLSGVTAIELGDQHGCALVTGGAVKCWGRGLEGQMGDGAKVSRKTPVTVAGISGATALGLGGPFSCALVSGGVRCWGTGPMGTASPTTSLAPKTISGLTSIKDLSGGTAHICALATSGRATCWGSNKSEQISNFYAFDGTSYFANKQIAAPTGISSLGLGSQSTCFLVAGGQVVCWGGLAIDYEIAGHNFEEGNEDPWELPAPVPVDGITGASQLTSGNGFACALVGASVRCWGHNDYGSLGTGAPILGTPQPVVFRQPG
jgi:alpha-tubulin suppressor-like RCC1 family protein